MLDGLQGSAIHNGILVEDYEKHKPSEMGKVKLEEYAKEFAAALKKKMDNYKKEVALAASFYFYTFHLSL